MSEEIKKDVKNEATSTVATTEKPVESKPDTGKAGFEKKPFARRNQRGGFGANNRGRFGGRDGNSKGGQGGRFGKRNNRNNRRQKPEEKDDFDSQIIQVKRVTRVVKGGKRMRFAALVVVGDKKGKVGYGLKKGMDFQESVAKATRQAKNNLLDIKVNDTGSIDFPTMIKYKSTSVMIKPADAGTGLISGGFVRPVLELVGLKNVYTKIIGSNNKTSGVQAVFEALKQHTK